MPDKFYILSTGRCGTTFLSKVIEKNLPEPAFLHQEKDSKCLNVYSNLAYSSPFFKKRLLNKLSKKYDKQLPPSTADPLKSLAYTYYLKEYLDNHPDIHYQLQLIHLIRDPRNFVSSFMNWKNRKISGKLAHHWMPFWMPEPGLRKRINMSKFEHFCWIWTIKNQLIKKTFGHLDNYRLYKIEEIHAEPEKLQELVKFTSNNDNIVIEDIDKYKNSPLRKSFPYWQEWNQKQALQLEQICGNLMRQYAYGDEDEWKALILKNSDEG